MEKKTIIGKDKKPQQPIKAMKKRKQKQAIKILTLGTLILLSSIALLQQERPHPSTDIINGTEYDTIVIFRNDDVTPWTDKEKLKKVEKIFQQQEIPLTHGIVPKDTANNQKITERKQLCEHLKNQTSENIDISLHGYNHKPETSFEGGSEFAGKTLQNQKQRIQKAENITENCTEQQTQTFIPPFNTYDKNTVKALNQTNYTLVSGGYNHQKQYFGQTNFYNAQKIKHLPHSSAFIEDWENQRKNNLEALKQDFRQNKKNHKTHVQMLHYFTFTEEIQLEKLENLIEYMKNYDVQFMTLEEFSKNYQTDKLIKTQNGWTIKEETQ